MSEIQKKTKQVRERPTWLKIVLGIVKYGWFPVACIAALIIGLSVGYVALGHQSENEVFQLQTWKHLFDLVFAN